MTIPTQVDITLTHALVNSGNAVELNALSFNYGWKNLINGSPVPGKYDTVGKTINGFENPTITISGVWDLGEQSVLNTPYTRNKEPDPTEPAVNVSKICQKLLVDFATVRSTTPLTLTFTLGDTALPLGGRPAGGYDTAGANTLSSTISVVIASFDLNGGVNSSREGQRVDFNIIFMETQ